MANPPAAQSPLDRLRKQVNAAADEFELATVFHETWRVAVDDTALHARLGTSYATNTFRVIMTALRRELLLALTRMWDKPKGALRIPTIADAISDPQMIALLASERGARIDQNMVRPSGGASRASIDAITNSVREHLDETARAILTIAGKYRRGGPAFTALEKLKALRNERLAHHEVEAVVAPSKNATDQEIEDFYQDNSELVRLLLSLVNATAYDPQEGAGVHQTYARSFWAGVKGERTEGHPFYRLPLKDRV